MWSCWPARDWTSQISYEAVASVVRELNVFEALMCFYTICTKYIELAHLHLADGFLMLMRCYCSLVDLRGPDCPGQHLKYIFFLFAWVSLIIFLFHSDILMSLLLCHWRFCLLFLRMNNNVIRSISCHFEVEFHRKSLLITLNI